MGMDPSGPVRFDPGQVVVQPVRLPDADETPPPRRSGRLRVPAALLGGPGQRSRSEARGSSEKLVQVSRPQSVPRGGVEKRDRNDWRVLDAQFEAWRGEFGPWTVEGCVDVKRLNAHAWAGKEEDFSVREDVMVQGLAGRQVYANPIFETPFMMNLFRHCNRELEKGVAGTSLCIVIPEFFWDMPSAHGVLARWHVLDTVPKGSQLFSTPDGYVGATRWDTFLVGREECVKKKKNEGNVNTVLLGLEKEMERLVLTEK